MKRTAVSLMFVIGGALPRCAQADGPCPRLAARLFSPSGLAEDYFGASVAFAGSSLLVGAWGADPAGDRSGAVYEYADIGGGWRLVAALQPLDAHALQRFGWSIAVDPDKPDTLVVGAPGDDELGKDSGAAYVFKRRADGLWVQQTKLVGEGTPPGAFFGLETAIDGRTLAVGAPFESLPLASLGGRVYVFEQDAGGHWTETTTLHPPTAFDGQFFGKAMALEGDTLVVGAPYFGMEFVDGFARVFQRRAGIWVEQQTLYGTLFGGRNRFGWAVAMMPGRIVVGAPRDGVPPLGYFNAFEPEGPGGAWVAVDTVLADEPTVVDRFAGALAGERQRLLVGAYNYDLTGRAFLYDLQGAGAELVCPLEATGLDDHDAFGVTVALQWPLAAVGAIEHDDASGAVYLFDASFQPADLDGDGDVDLADFGIFAACVAGPGNPPAGACPKEVDADLDADGDVDFADFGILQPVFTGS